MNNNDKYIAEKISIDGHLRYLVENCQIALQKLASLSTELLDCERIDSPRDPKPIGDLERMVKDYLIIRVTGLFDEKPYTASFEAVYSDNVKYNKIKNAEIIQYMKKMRGTFVAHTHKKLSLGFPDSRKILQSDLAHQLKGLLQILPSGQDA